MVAHVILVSPQVLWLGFGLSDFGLGLDNIFIKGIELTQEDGVENIKYQEKVEDLEFYLPEFKIEDYEAPPLPEYKLPEYQASSVSLYNLS